MSDTSVGTAYVDFRGDFSNLNKEVSKLLGPLTSKFGKLGAAAGVGLGVVATGAVAAGKALYDVGAEFDDAYDKITVKTGATGKHLKALEGDFKSVVSSVPADFGDAADAVGDLNARLGVTGKPLRELSKQMLEVSRLTESDLGENIQSVTRLFADWSVKTAKQPATLDKLFRASQATGIGISNLATLMVQFGSPLRQMGFDFDTAAAMFSQFEQQGVNMQTLMPGLRFALANFSGPTAELAKEFKALGVNLQDPAVALQQVFDQIKKAPTDLKANALAFDVFGKRAGPDMAAAVREGRFDLDGLMQTIRRGHGSVMGASRDTRDLSENWKILTNRLKVLVEPAASAVFATISDLSAKLAKLNFGQLARSLGTSGSELREFGHNVSDIFRRVSPVVGDALHHAGAFLKDFAGVVRGIVKIVSGLLQGNFGKAWDGVKQTFRSAIGATLHLLLGMTAPIRALGAKIGGALGDAFGAAWDFAKDVFRGGVNDIIDLLNSMIGLINKLPFVEIGKIGHLGGGSKEVKRQMGGIVPGSGDGDRPGFAAPAGSFVLNREATKAYGRQSGGIVPLALEAGERVFLPREVSQIGRGRLEAMNTAVPRFQTGGAVQALSLGGDVVAAGESLVGKGAGFVIDQLPNPADYVPTWLGDFGGYLRKAAADWIEEGFDEKKFGSLTIAPGVAGYTGPPADMKQFGNNRYVDSHTLAVTAFLDKMFGLTMSSGYRSTGHNAEIGGAPGSLHTHGSPSNPGATDSVGPMGAMHSYIAYAKQHVAGLKEAMVDNYAGQGWNAHLGFFELGGLVEALAGGGVVGEVGSILMRNSLDLVSAAGILGNAWRESRWDPSAVGTGGGGLWGFTTSPISLEDLKAYAASRGAPWTDELAQTQFMLHHLPSSMRGAMNAMGDVEGTTTYFMNEWEKPGVPALDERIDGAKKALKILDGKGGAAGAADEKVPAEYHGAKTGTLSFGSTPKSLGGVEKELRQRRSEVRRYRAAARAAEGKPQTQQAIQHNVTALEGRIRELERARADLRRAAAQKKFTKKLGRKLAKLTGFENVIAGRERAFDIKNLFAEQLVDTEPLAPELPASATDAQREAVETQHVADLTRYIEGPEKQAFGELLGLGGDWRNTILEAERAAAGNWQAGKGIGGLEGGWESDILSLANQIEHISSLPGTHTDKWWHDHPKALKHMREQLAKLPMLRFKERELRKVLGEGREQFYPGGARVDRPSPPLAGSGAFEDALVNVQGVHWPDQHEMLGSIPGKRVPGFFGGVLWDVQGSLEGLGLKVSEAATSIGGGGAGGDSADNSEYTRLLEELLAEERGKDRLREIEKRVFGAMPPYAGKAHQGAIVPGPPGAERTMVVQSGEGILPERKVKALQGLAEAAPAGGDVRVLIHGNIVSSHPDPVEVLIGDERFKAEVREIGRSEGRREARGARRGLARPGVFTS